MGRGSVVSAAAPRRGHRGRVSVASPSPKASLSPGRGGVRVEQSPAGLSPFPEGFLAGSICPRKGKGRGSPIPALLGPARCGQASLLALVEGQMRLFLHQ